MTSYFDEAGRNIACTIVEAEPNAITQVKTEETDGYNALQLGFDDAKEKNVTSPLMGHFNKAGVAPKRKVKEFRDFYTDKGIGESISIEDLFEVGDKVSAIGVSKGKGFQGVVKRHQFRGVGDATHGQHNRLRAPGSIGASSTPSRVFKGMRMAGQMGNERVKITGLNIVKVFPEKNLLVVSGAIPGHKGSYVIIEK